MAKWKFSNFLMLSSLNSIRQGSYFSKGSIGNYRHNEFRRFSKLFYQLFHVPKDDEIPDKTIGDLKRDSPKMLDLEDINFNPDDYKKTMEDRKAFAKYMPKSQDEIPTRKMLDSFILTSIPVGSQPELRDRFASAENHIRVSRMIENFDTICVCVGNKHIRFPAKPGIKLTYGILTTLIDSVVFTEYVPRGDVDLRLYGHVTWAGKSSLEVIASLDQKIEGSSQPKLIAQCICILTLKDMLNNKIGFVNRLQADSQEEKDYMKTGEARVALRNEKKTWSIFKTTSTEDERKYIRDTFYSVKDIFTLSSQGLKSYGSKELSVLMKDTCLSSVKITEPQDRNHYYTIFGGYTLRHSYELAYATAWAFSNQKIPPAVRCADDLIFKVPIFIGDLLKFSAAIGYVEGNLIHCFVTLRILNPGSGKANTSNSFHYVFEASEDKKLPVVVPVSYEETMLYIDCMRRFKRLKKLNVL